ncbi:FAD-dependent oxidoreductase [Actinophytocola algeriensis]|uniref:2-polyprenyl-6-methoxyphenol hydroxylase-like FAD-dependent oxidoreductase n=1 Tax=Actinophytocola algeriensis TaxID=1768010 RepID=A0A7W7Q7I0_9PSEU|nr:FAD-dependent oxidoreductase [Actinophytocola algeriensis]MBB4908273.1 2-polyprenyl-6-methoxyphenol hydroxylase-like FAD-dependent oxidoreductase [Actinophytocola algeriensis]MBE1480303.1 2-polyprenyl-6-methoxyphenol hydroxylase-like FAD-dependent oxidoreductase [Actinophytocola algeriensis]
MTNVERTTCLVAGGGPAGMVLGLLLARAGVAVTVLEKHADFLRDFRGDTVHPTTLDLLDELGLGDEFAKLPQSRLERAQLPTRQGMVPFGDFTQLPGKHNYVAMVPQWDLLDLLADAAKQEPSFTLRMETEAVGVIWDHGRVAGVEYRTTAGATGQILADLTIAADGRHSALRAAAGMKVRDYPTPMDVWWFRLPRRTGDPAGAVGVMSQARAVIMLDRDDYWQTAVLIRKGSDAAQRKEPVSSMVAGIAEVVPWLTDRVDTVSSWDDVKLLDVRVDRLSRWYTDGLLCIGDAAHAMSPVGGVGINLAVQDAVAAATLLAAPLVNGTVSTRDLAKVQRRRLLPTVITQGVQRFLHARVLKPALAGKVEIARAAKLPVPVRMMTRFPKLRRIPAYVVGRGFRPEHAPPFARR